MKSRLKKRNGFWLALSLVLMLVSATGASLTQTSAGSVTVKDMRWETSSGTTMSALLYKPNSASADKPLPAIVVSHGWWNNREMQDANYVELSRRGYVVVSIDMYGHGNSGYLTAGQEAVNGTGMYDAVKLVADLPYVDKAKIGVTGHSNGARAANFSIPIDNEAETQLISAVLLVDNDGFYQDTANGNAYYNLYGARDVGIVADHYDEFFFRSYDANGTALTAPRDYIGTPNAQSFLAFGADPTTVKTKVGASEVVTKSIDGREAMRVVYTPAETHPWGPFSKTTTESVISFFDQALGAPHPIAASNQIWQIKAGFNALGLVGFVIFLVAFTRAMLTTRAFAGLRANDDVDATPTSPKGLAWFWGSLTVSAIAGAWIYVAMSQSPTMAKIAFNLAPSIFVQGAVAFIALWAAITGVVSIIIMVISYFFFGKRNGLNLRETGVLPGWRAFFHSIGLAAVVVTAAFGIVFVVDYFFKTDFRLWVLAIKAFTPDKLAIAALYLPFFAVYYVANSVAINGFNRFTLRGKEWLNTAVLAFFNSLGPIVLVIAQYSTFFITGETIPGFGGIFSIWLIPVIVILAATAVISRKIYRATNNPYVAGFINAAVVTIVSVTNTLTYN